VKGEGWWGGRPKTGVGIKTFVAQLRSFQVKPPLVGGFLTRIKGLPTLLVCIPPMGKMLEVTGDQRKLFPSGGARKIGEPFEGIWSD